MKLNHINLAVTEPIETQKFLQEYFELKPKGRGNSRMVSMFPLQRGNMEHGLSISEHPAGLRLKSSASG